MIDLICIILLALGCLFNSISVALIVKYYVRKSDNNNA